MLKEDLIALIQDNVPDGADVRFLQPSHDYWRTQLAIDIGTVEELPVKVSAYHGGVLAVIDEEKLDPEEEHQLVYVLS